MKAKEIKLSGKHGNTIIVRFKDNADKETEEKVMQSLVETYETRIEGKILTTSQNWQGNTLCAKIQLKWFELAISSKYGREKTVRGALNEKSMLFI